MANLDKQPIAMEKRSGSGSRSITGRKESRVAFYTERLTDRVASSVTEAPTSGLVSLQILPSPRSSPRTACAQSTSVLDAGQKIQAGSHSHVCTTPPCVCTTTAACGPPQPPPPPLRSRLRHCASRTIGACSRSLPPPPLPLPLPLPRPRTRPPRPVQTRRRRRSLSSFRRFSTRTRRRRTPFRPARSTSALRTLCLRLARSAYFRYMHISL
jgi:hypothetical protein